LCWQPGKLGTPTEAHPSPPRPYRRLTKNGWQAAASWDMDTLYKVGTCAGAQWGLLLRRAAERKGAGAPWNGGMRCTLCRCNQP